MTPPLRLGKRLETEVFQVNIHEVKGIEIIYMTFSQLGAPRQLLILLY